LFLIFSVQKYYIHQDLKLRFC